MVKLVTYEYKRNTCGRSHEVLVLLRNANNRLDMFWRRAKGGLGPASAFSCRAVVKSWTQTLRNVRKCAHFGTVVMNRTQNCKQVQKWTWHFWKLWSICGETWTLEKQQKCVCCSPSPELWPSTIVTLNRSHQIRGQLAIYFCKYQLGGWQQHFHTEQL